MRKITLTRGMVALVDAADYDRLSQHTWCCIEGEQGHAYAVRFTRVPKRRLVRMHREIMDAPEGMFVDHINGDGLDNRRANLRLVSRGENRLNVRRPGHRKLGPALAAGAGRRKTGTQHPWWRGGRSVDSQGYVSLLLPNHPAATGRGRVREHVLLATAALGRPLPRRAVVHHANGDPSDNRPGNLVLCQDQSYHLLLHRRARALKESGHADWARCCICGTYGPPEALPRGRHRSCHANYERARRAVPCA